jgi:dTDP-4-amino-4,6-dideoxygalactose transaminase
MYEEQELPATEYFTARVLSLPLHLDLTDDEIGYVCGLIKEGW